MSWLFSVQMYCPTSSFAGANSETFSIVREFLYAFVKQLLRDLVVVDAELL